MYHKDAFPSLGTFKKWDIKGGYVINGILEISAILLAGGKSRRMVRNKGLLPFAGKPLVAHLCERLSTLSSDRVIVTQEEETYPFLKDVRVIADVFPGQGPLAGIHAGLLQILHERAVVSACDFPFLAPEVLRQLAKVALEEEADVVVPQDGEKEYPVLAVYSRRIVPVAEERLRRGANRLRAFCDELEARGYSVRRIPVGELLRGDPSGLTFFNMNTPDDYRIALELWEKEAGLAGSEKGDKKSGT